MAAPTIDELTTGIRRVAGDMEKSREGAEGIVNSFTELLNKLLPIGVALKGFQVLTGGMFSHYGKALTSLTKHTSEIYAQQRAVQTSLRDLRVKYNALEINVRQYRDIRLEATAALHVLRAQAVLAHELERVGRATLGVAALYLGMMVKTLDTTVRYNEALAEANSGFFRRLELMRAMGHVQVATGTAQANLINATRALVRQGLESKTTFEANLKTVVMLHDAVGMSAEEAAHLAAVTENYAKASFQDVADVVATIVDQTALAAAEVKNLGVELQRALGVLTPGQTNLPQVIQALSGYEAALKEVTGRVGAFQKLVGTLATPEGMMQAGMLGVTPDIIKTKEGIDMVMARFENLVNRVVGNSEGLNRVWRLDTVAKMMNLSREEVSEMVRALEHKRSMDIKELTLQELYARQVTNMNDGVVRLTNSLSSLLQQGLYPFVRVLSWVINTLATLIQKLADWRGAVYIAIGVVGAAGIVLVNRLRAATRAFIELAGAAQLATERIRANAAAQLATRIPVPVPGGAGGTGIGGMLSRLMTGLTRIIGGMGPIGRQIASNIGLYRLGLSGFRQVLMMSLRAVIAGISGITLGVGSVLAVGGYLWYKIWRTNKDSAEESARVNRMLSQRSQTLEQARRDRAYTEMRYGGTEAALRSTERLMRDAALRMRQIEGKSYEEISAELSKMGTQAIEDLTKAAYTETIMGQRFNVGQFDSKAWILRMVKVVETISEDIRKTEANTKTGIKQDKEQAADADRMTDEQNTLWKLIQGRFQNFPPPNPNAGSWGNWPAMQK